MIATMKLTSLFLTQHAHRLLSLDRCITVPLSSYPAFFEPRKLIVLIVILIAAIQLPMKNYEQTEYLIRKQHPSFRFVACFARNAVTLDSRFTKFRFFFALAVF